MSNRSKIRRIFYILKKIRQRISQALFTEFSQFIRIKHQSNFSSLTKVGFYLDNPLFTHLGDQLFFEPALRLISKKVDTCIRPTAAMTEYFTKSGAKVINNDRIFDCNTIVTRYELISEVKLKTKANIILINTLSRNMQYRVSEEITRKLASFFKIKIPENFNFSPWKPIPAKQEDSATKIILAPYVDSGWFRIWKTDVDQLSLHAKKYADEFGGSLCLAGGKINLEAKIPSIIKPHFEDWRGRHNPYQFMQILASGQISRVFTFDTFVFHAAVACGIPVTVKIRRGLTKKTQFIKDHFLPAYSNVHQEIDFL